MARSTKQLIETVEELARRGIGFRCLTQDIDTTTAGGRLVFTIFSAIAEFEREIITDAPEQGLMLLGSEAAAAAAPRRSSLVT